MTIQSRFSLGDITEGSKRDHTVRRQLDDFYFRREEDCHIWAHSFLPVGFCPPFQSPVHKT